MKILILFSFGINASALRMITSSAAEEFEEVAHSERGGKQKRNSNTTVDISRGPTDNWLENEIAAGLPLRKSMDLNNLPMKHLENPCEADMLVGLLPTGLGSKMNRLMDHIGLASYGGFSFALGGKTNFMAEWKELFSQTLPICESAGKDWKHKYGNWEGPFRDLSVKFTKELKEKDPAFIIDLRRALYKKFFKLADQTQHRVTETLKEIGYPDDNQVIAVHIRRGDKKKEASPVENEKYGNEIVNAVRTIPLRNEGEESVTLNAEKQHAYYGSVARKIKDAIEEHGTQIKKVFIGSDDSEVQEAMAKILGETYEIIGFKSKEWKGTGRSKEMYGDHDYMYGVLTDIEAFKRSAFFIGTGSSGFSQIAYFLRDGNQKSVSMDEEWLNRVGH